MLAPTAATSGRRRRRPRISASRDTWVSESPKPVAEIFSVSRCEALNPRLVVLKRHSVFSRAAIRREASPRPPPVRRRAHGEPHPAQEFESRRWRKAGTLCAGLLRRSRTMRNRRARHRRQQQDRGGEYEDRVCRWRWPRRAARSSPEGFRKPASVPSSTTQTERGAERCQHEGLGRLAAPLPQAPGRRHRARFASRGSRSRLVILATSSPVTFAHAISRTQPAAPSASHSRPRRSPAIRRCRPTTLVAGSAAMTGCIADG